VPFAIVNTNIRLADTIEDFLCDTGIIDREEVVYQKMSTVASDACI